MGPSYLQWEHTREIAKLCLLARAQTQCSKILCFRSPCCECKPQEPHSLFPTACLIPIQNHSWVHITPLPRQSPCPASTLPSAQIDPLAGTHPAPPQPQPSVCYALAQTEPLVYVWSVCILHPSQAELSPGTYPNPQLGSELLVQLGVLSQRSQDHTARALPEGPRVHPSLAAGSAQQNACQGAMGPHRVIHQRNCTPVFANPEKWRDQNHVRRGNNSEVRQ